MQKTRERFILLNFKNHFFLLLNKGAYSFILHWVLQIMLQILTVKLFVEYTALLLPF
jgi:hypothetical protein